MRFPVNLAGGLNICLLWTFCALCFESFSVASGNPQFIKVNSHTRSRITKIAMTSDKSGYFLAGNIFCFDKFDWARLDIPISQPINLISPFEYGDYWLTINTPLNTSELFHYINNRLEKVSSPFANPIAAIHFVNKELGFFAGWNEIAVYSNGKFYNLAAPTTTRPFIKIHGISEARFWVLAESNELFLFEQKAYKRILAEEKVIDICFYDGSNGVILCASGIFSVSGSQCRKIFSHSDLEFATRIEAKDPDDIWLAGEKGLVRRLNHGILQAIPHPGMENLKDICLGSNNDVWISGDMGLLLYSGSMQIAQSPPDNPGFTKQKLYEYGGEANDEYGVAIADFNGDGMKDIYSVCIFSANRLYVKSPDSVENLIKGNWFREEAIKRGASGMSRDGNIKNSSELHLGVAVADVDNDGDQDIYLCCLNGKNKLLLNDGTGYFRDVSDQKNRACEDLKRSNAAVFADADNDGDLDLFVTNEQGSNSLYLNDGTGHFRDVTAVSGLVSVMGGMCASFADINNDGLPDLCVSFWSFGNKLYLNESRGGIVRFTDITARTDISKSESARSNGVVFGDVNNDGSPDLLIINRNAPNKLYINDDHGRFRDFSRQYLGDRIFLSNGAVIADFDLDGYNDIYITNVGENVLYKNIGGKYFNNATSEFNAELYGYGTGCAVGDMDNDGLVDMYVGNYINGNSLLFLNTLEQKKSVKFILTGTRSNRDAIGAKVFLYKQDTSGKEQLAGYKEINGGGGYASVSAKEAVFGILPGSKYSAFIKFPSSEDTLIVAEIRPGDVFRISEENGIFAFRSLSMKAVKRMILDPENQLNIIKFLFVLGIIVSSLLFQRRRATLKLGLLFIIYFIILCLFVLINRMLQFEATGVSFIIPPLVAITCLVVLHLLTTRIRLKRRAEKEKQEVRENISRDLHDDLASTLGSISIYSDTLNKRAILPEKDQHDISVKITELSHSALQSITDIIWMTSPRNDSLKSLLSKIRNYYFDLFNDNRIRLSAEIDVSEIDFEMKDPLRQNVFLILKETAANIIRHSNADLVTLKVKCSEGYCHIKVKDNGYGFDPEKVPEDIQGGNGLINMQRRAAESGILLDIRAEVGTGAQVSLSFKMT